MIARGTSPERPQPAHVTRGLVVFVAVMVLPAVLAFVIVFGAWAVSDEVYAAERAAAAGAPIQVAPWKTTLVGICPIH